MAEKGESFESDILEGFLCPICKADLKTLSRLKIHFQENHPEDQDVLKSLKGLFGKATKKILKLDETVEPIKPVIEYSIESEIQEIGYIKKYTQMFKTFRCNRLEHFATETNKLIIRLDQLLLVDNIDRKQHEQNVVHWLDGSSVKLCPQCAKPFNLTRRQHHCRLCGTIMCHGCTLFLALSTAKSIISGSFADNPIPKEINESNSLRICGHCMEMLDHRRRVLVNRMVQPVICDYYHQLKNIKSSIEPDIELFKKMCGSLQAGESIYNLADAQSLRRNIGKKGEIMDAISKRIANIPLDENNPRAVTLQNAIRRATSNYIKETILSLPVLPTPQELLKKRNAFQNSGSQSTNSKPVVPKVLDGWSPVISDKILPESEEIDPLLQQMNIVKGYISQARKAMKFEEVASLETHLKELEEVYHQQQMSQNSTTSSEEEYDIF